MSRKERISLKDTLKRVENWHFLSKTLRGENGFQWGDLRECLTIFLEELSNFIHFIINVKTWFSFCISKIT
jgi:hypothetical protein